MSRAEIIETMARALAAEIAKPAHENLDEVPSRGAAMAACLALSRAISTALEAAGMAVVPREPTARMIIAGASAKPFANRMNTQTAAGVWSAMLAAALPTRSE